MPAPNAIKPDKLARLVASAGAPRIVDLRDRPSEAIPGSLFQAHPDPTRWGYAAGSTAVLVDADDGGPAAAAAAILRSEGVAAEVLEGGFAAWAASALPTVSLTHLPSRHDDGRTWWVTRARPKVDRIACPWLIRRFVDPEARFLFVAPGEVLTVATQQQAEPFDIADEGVFWSHRGEHCTFNVMVEAFGLDTHQPLARLATIVRGADTDRLDLAPEAAGLLAISLGLSRIHNDDHVQLEAGMAVYDALYRWCRDAQGEKHDWSSHQPTRGKVSA
jgi:rhodanese-related sulfurtransferase